MFGNLTGFMSNDQVAVDTKALQSYIEQVKNIEKSADVAAEKQRIFSETLKDSSQIARDVAQNTNNLDDVMKVYTASTKTATSVAKAFGTTLLGIGKTIGIAILASVVAARISKALQWADENWIHPYEAARDKAAEMSQAHEEAAQKVEDLTQQIEELKAKMDECRSTTTGEIVDPQSYAALNKQKDQLEINLKLAQQLAEESALAKAKAQCC